MLSPRHAHPDRRPHRPPGQRSGPLRRGADQRRRPTSCCPWATRLWEDNLQFVGGIQRAYAADISPDDSCFVVGSGSGGDRPPINDTIAGSRSTAAPTSSRVWISRHFDSVYSVAITEQWRLRSAATSVDRVADRPRPVAGSGRRRLRHRPGPVGLRPRRRRRPARPHRPDRPGDRQGTRVVPRSPTRPRARRPCWPPRGGLLIGGDATTKGGYNVGRIAVFDFSSIPAANGTNTTIVDPIEGRVKRPKRRSPSPAPPRATSGVNRVELTVFDRDTQPLPRGQPDHVADRQQHDRHDARPRLARPTPPGRCR